MANVSKSQMLARQEPIFAESLDEFDHAKEVRVFSFQGLIVIFWMP